MLSMFPVYVMIAFDMVDNIQKRDIFNVIRHTTVIGPCMGASFKMFLMFVKRVQAKEIIEEMNRDFARYNNLPDDCQSHAERAIASSVFYIEKLWIYIVTTTILLFPGVAALWNILSLIFTSEPKKYMVHDLKIPYTEPETRFASPYFELGFVYMTYIAMVCGFNYGPYDGFYGLAANHACLKMSMDCKLLEHALKAKDTNEKYNKIIEFIEEQKRTFHFVELLQDTFNIWMTVICASTMIEIASLLIHVSAGYGFDFRYTMFSMSAVVHIFLPCKYAANLKSMAKETSWLIYSCGWETAEWRLWRLLVFILARAQRPCRLTICGNFDFDMELFMFMMKTSYSTFTLLRS
ncbi:hypothetical protein ACJJTC_019091 [Scirpophaga incertulas]